MVVAAFVFMYRMSEAVEVTAGVKLMDSAEDELQPETDKAQRTLLPEGVEAFQITGPLFFGAASRLDNVLDQFFRKPRVFILRMRLVPMMDASGVHALSTLAGRCRQQGIVLVVSGLQEQPRRVVAKMNLQQSRWLHMVPNFYAAVRLAETLGDSSRDIAGPAA